MSCRINFLLALYVLFQALRSSRCAHETGSGYEQQNMSSGVDFFLGGLLPIHSSVDYTCDSIRTHISGVEYTEAMLFALDSINSNSSVLPNITLGYDIRDTCSIDYIAIDASSKWVTTKIAENSCDCPFSTWLDRGPLLVGVIGGAFSSVSSPVASLLRPFEIPQISYASTSSSLNDRQRYSYFLRTVPPDNLQATAMVDILLEMGWTVVSGIHSNELYGETGMEEFRNAIAETDICMDLDERIDENFSDEEYSKLASKFVDESVANVVIFFALDDYAFGFFQELSKIETDRKFLWIASDGWAESQEIQSTFADEVAGMIGIVPFNEQSQAFNQYFAQLTPQTNTRDPWFEEFCDTYLQQSLPSAGSEQKCSPNTSILDFPQYTQDVYVPTLIDAVYSVAYGLHDFLTENCDHPIVWNAYDQSCHGQKMAINGSVLLNYITKANFVSLTGRHIQYSKDGYVEESTYEVKNLQKTGSMSKFTVVAYWNPKAKLNYKIPQNNWQFGLTSEGDILHTLKSECTICQTGSVTLLLPSSCCNLCTQCLANNYSNTTTATSCSQCGNHMWGNNPLNGSEHCVPINESFLSYVKPWGIVLLILQIVGILSVVSVALIIFIFVRKNPSIRSFGIEQLFVIFIGLILCFLLPVLYVLKPSVPVCAIQQLLLWFSLTLIFAALLVKLIRITRIFLGSSGGRRRRFVEPHYQIIFTIIIVSGQMVLVAIAMAVTHPGPFYFQQNSTVDPNDFPELIVTCKQPHPAMLVLLVVYESILIILINGLAIFTIRFPKNFNESRHIAFATFAIGMIWLAFIPTYVATDNEVRTASIALAVMLMGFAVLGCLIGPRLYTALHTLKSREQSFSMHTKPNEFSLQLSGTYKKDGSNVISAEKPD